MSRSFNRYVVVGVANTLIDLGIFSALALVLSVPSLGAHVISTAIVMSLSFVVNRAWVFASDASASRTAVPFVAVTLFSALVVQSTVIALVQITAANIVPNVVTELIIPMSKIAAMGAGMFFNYFGYRLVFARARP